MATDVYNRLVSWKRLYRLREKCFEKSLLIRFLTTTPVVQRILVSQHTVIKEAVEQEKVVH